MTTSVGKKSTWEVKLKYIPELMIYMLTLLDTSENVGLDVGGARIYVHLRYFGTEGHETQTALANSSKTLFPRFTNDRQYAQPERRKMPNFKSCDTNGKLD